MHRAAVKNQVRASNALIPLVSTSLTIKPAKTSRVYFLLLTLLSICPALAWWRGVILGMPAVGRRHGAGGPCGSPAEVRLRVRG